MPFLQIEAVDPLKITPEVIYLFIYSDFSWDLTLGKGSYAAKPEHSDCWPQGYSVWYKIAFPQEKQTRKPYLARSKS